MRLIDEDTVINISDSEKKAILTKPQNNTEIAKNTTQSTTWRIVSFGTNSSLIAIQMIGNSIMLSSLGPTEQAASSLITAIQSFVSGTTFGFLTNTGVELGNALGKRGVEENEQEENNKEIEAVIKTSWMVGSSLCLLGTASFLSTRFILPHILDHDTAEAVGQFFTTFSIGAFSEPMGGNNGIIIAQVEKNMVLPLLIAASYRLPAIGLGYVFSKTLKMGVSGLGLGIAIAGITAFLGSQALLMRSTYKRFHLYNRLIPDFRNHLKSYLNGGWKLSLQRITEWGNLVALTTLIGYLNNSALQALQPAIQANTLIGLTMQGMGQASMMFVVEDCKKQKKYYEEFRATLARNKLIDYKNSIEMNKYTFIKNNAVGLGVAIALSIIIYLSRRPIINLFLGSDISQEQNELAQSLMLVTLLGLIPDTLRIVSGGILRGWGDLLYPTLMSLILMTALGVPIGAGISLATDKNISSILWVRFVSIFLAAAFNCYRFYQHNNNDKKLYNDGENLLNIYEYLENWQTLDRNGNGFNQKLNDFGLSLFSNDLINLNDLLGLIISKVGVDENDEINQIKISVAQDILEKINDYVQQYACDKQSFINNLSRYDQNHYIILKSIANILKVNIAVIHEGSPYTNFVLEPEITDSNQINTLYLFQSQNGQYYVLQGKPTESLTEVVLKLSNPQTQYASGYGSLFYTSRSHNPRIAINQSTADLVEMINIQTQNQFYRSNMN